MRSWLAEVLRVTANHLSPIKPVVMKCNVHSAPGVNEAISKGIQQSLTYTGRRM
ncbi:hypothetical protein RhoFasB10_03769 [Rhodococcus sp. B10]|nr:hypothetical protein [Rhodococcus sp. B10]